MPDTPALFLSHGMEPIVAPVVVVVILLFVVRHVTKVPHHTSASMSDPVGLYKNDSYYYFQPQWSQTLKLIQIAEWHCLE